MSAGSLALESRPSIMLHELKLIWTNFNQFSFQAPIIDHAIRAKILRLTVTVWPIISQSKETVILSYPSLLLHLSYYFSNVRSCSSGRQEI